MRKNHEGHEGNTGKLASLFFKCLMLSMVNFLTGPDKLPDGLNLVIHHLDSETGIGAEKESLIHDGVGAGEQGADG